MEEKNEEFKKGAAVIAFDGNMVLLVRNGEASGHTTGIYGLPAGSLREGEEYVDAAAREFNEESGLQTEIRYLVKLPTFYEAVLKRKDGQKKFCAWSYYCTQYWGELASTEETQPLWVEISKVSNYPLQVNVDKMIAEALEYRKSLG